MKKVMQWLFLLGVSVSAITLPVWAASAPSTSGMPSDDTIFWKRAGNNVYVGVRTSLSPNFGTSLFDTEPGQTLYLFTYSSSRDVTAAQWYVNSEWARVTPGGDMLYKGRKAASALFIASRPGIFTVQTLVDGTYSVPLVINVGVDQWRGTPVSMDPRKSGILPLTGDLPSPMLIPVLTLSSRLTVMPYPAGNGWVPVKGKARSPDIRAVTVDFASVDGNREWNYTIPVAQDRSFGAWLRVPFQGQVHVFFSTDLFGALNQNGGRWSPDAVYTISVNAPALSEQEQGLLASAWVDYNLHPVFLDTASRILAHATSVDTAIEAISHYVSTRMVYDWAGFRTGQYVYQDAGSAWTSATGVCANLVEITAAMLRSVGIPAETVIGSTSGSAGRDSHEWLRAWDGARWLVLDPTWNSPNKNVNRVIVNEYVTVTESFQKSHVADSERIGSAE
jgi:transglutaminase-like putative cysteine protease